MVRRGEQWAKVHDPNGKWNWKLSYQSRVGPVEWLRPYTEDAIKESAAGGGTLLLVPISFVSDHIETLFEMDITYKNLAKESGFKDCLRVAMPNEDRKFGEVLFEILKTWGL
jgi:ferrochelatase